MLFLLCKERGIHFSIILLKDRNSFNLTQNSLSLSLSLSFIKMPNPVRNFVIVSINSVFFFTSRNLTWLFACKIIWVVYPRFHYGLNFRFILLLDRLPEEVYLHHVIPTMFLHSRREKRVTLVLDFTKDITVNWPQLL